MWSFQCFVMFCSIHWILQVGILIDGTVPKLVWNRQQQMGWPRTHTNACAYIYIKTYVCMYVCMYVNIDRHTYSTYIYIYLYTYLHTHIYIHMHIYIYIYTVYSERERERRSIVTWCSMGLQTDKHNSYRLLLKRQNHFFGRLNVLISSGN